MTRYVVLLDGSEASLEALEHALEKADEVIGVYLIDCRAFKGLNEDMARALEEFMRQEAELIGETVKERGAEFEIVRGEGPEAVMEYAREVGADAVVVGVGHIPGFEDITFRRGIEGHVKDVPVILVPSR
ncbi:universal stress protein [Methanopyrus sp.]